MVYDNRQYWSRLHEKFKGQLKAVGHPFLCDCLNQLKYASEASAMDQVLQQIMDSFRKDAQRSISYLDIGAGTGYWTDLISGSFLSQGYGVDVAALDVSDDALDVIRERLPFAHRIKEDLRTIAPNASSESYHLVSSCYCLHHLTKTDDFVNAIKFAGSSVKKGGFLLIMDPVLTRRFSEFDTIDFYSFRGNGIPRHLYFIDDILFGLGLKRSAIYPAVSFLLNGHIEAQNSWSYVAMSRVWDVLCIVYRSERLTCGLSGILVSLDRMLKRMNLSFSSSICVYHKDLD